MITWVNRLHLTVSRTVISFAMSTICFILFFNNPASFSLAKILKINDFVILIVFKP